MPAHPTTRQIADVLYAAATDIHTSGLWFGAPAFAAALGSEVDPVAAIYKAATGSLPYLFAVPQARAATQAKEMVYTHLLAAAAVTALAARIDVNDLGNPGEDPVEKLAGWLHWPHMTASEVIGRMRAVADELLAARTVLAA